MKEIDAQEIERRFTYHAPDGNQPQRYEFLRALFKDVAFFICKNTPISREQSLALTHLEQSNFYANAAIARRENKTPDKTPEASGNAIKEFSRTSYGFREPGD